jgi:hypothetical protein
MQVLMSELQSALPSGLVWALMSVLESALPLELMLA